MIEPSPLPSVAMARGQPPPLTQLISPKGRIGEDSEGHGVSS